MTFDQLVLLWSVAAPVLIAAMSCGLTHWICSRRPESRIAAFVLLVGWWIGVAVALAGRQGWQWWPEDAWRQAIWPALAWAVAAAIFGRGQMNGPDQEVADRSASDRSDSDRGASDQSWYWVATAVLACATALIAMPSDEQWSDTFHLHRVWMFAVTTSCLTNAFAIHCMARRGARRWVLLIALTAPVIAMILSGAAYASLAEWALAVTAATITIAFWGTCSSSRHAWLVAMPVVSVAAGITAAARFYTYEDLPHWIYAVALYGPAIIAVIDAPIRTCSAWLRVAVSGLAAITLIGLTAWAALLA